MRFKNQINKLVKEANQLIQNSIKADTNTADLKEVTLCCWDPKKKKALVMVSTHVWNYTADISRTDKDDILLVIRSTVGKDEWTVCRSHPRELMVAIKGL